MKCKRVFILGIDGAGNAPKTVPTPNLDRVFNNGVYTYNAQASIPTISGECWGSILTGVLPEKHGLTNAIASSQPYPEDSPYPTVFKLSHQNNPSGKLASFSCWSPINTGIIEQSTGCYFRSDEDSIMVAEIVEYLKSNDPTLFFLQLDGCDGAGHEFGYFTPKHFEAVQEADRLVGLILDTIEAQGMLEDSVIIVLADHGGGGDKANDHGSAHPQDATVFWGCRAPFIKERGAEIKGSVHIADTAATAAHALGLSFPSEIHGKAITSAE